MNEKINIVYCKNSINVSRFGEFIKGNYYNKFYLETEQINTIEIPYKYKYIYIFSKLKGGLRFHLDKNNKNYLPCFYDYFYDDKEIRKLKLKKLK